MVAVLQPLKKTKAIPIDRAVILVGRADDCDVVITGSKKISRKHCCLVQSDDIYLIRDLGSTNGVWINGRRVDREGQMTEGDRVAIGDVQFDFYPKGVRSIKRRPAQSKPRSKLAGSGIEIDLEDDAPSDPVLVDDAEILTPSSSDRPVAEKTPATPARSATPAPAPAEDLPSATPPPAAEEPFTVQPLDSEPVINLDDCYGDDNPEDIFLFDDD